MKSLLTRATLLAALVPMGMALPVAAQSLGSVVSDPWIGRPLELSVPARFASADSRDECVQADVFYGEQRLPRDQVRASVGGPAGDRMVRIASGLLISEPVVTVSLRIGCGSTVTRAYTLLPAMPTDPVLAAAAARSAGAGAVPSASPIRLASVMSPSLRPTGVVIKEPPPRARAARTERARDGG
ncbi:MAG: hypothetical protein JWP65_1884, partial [Ramlibacter sp.]|nr:hypothetical protein [Ramlibacter sp.]